MLLPQYKYLLLNVMNYLPDFFLIFDDISTACDALFELETNPVILGYVKSGSMQHLHAASYVLASKCNKIEFYIYLDRIINF